MDIRELIENALYSAGLDAEAHAADFVKECNDITGAGIEVNKADYIAYAINKAAYFEALHASNCAMWAPIE